MPGVKGKSGGKRSGAGRPASFKARHGDYLIFQQETIGDIPRKDKLVQIIGVSNDEIEFQVGDTIYVLRRIDETDNVVLVGDDK